MRGKWVVNRISGWQGIVADFATIDDIQAALLGTIGVTTTEVGSYPSLLVATMAAIGYASECYPSDWALGVMAPDGDYEWLADGQDMVRDDIKSLLLETF